DRYGRADFAGPRAPEEGRRVRDPDQSAGGHLEDSELVRRPESVLRRAKNAVRVVSVALELEHAVDEVLQDAWACDGAVLRHVADEDGCDTAALRHAEQTRRRFPPLRHGAGRRSELARVQRLHRVDHADVGLLLLERRADGVELRLGEDRHVVGAAPPLPAEAHLGHRFLAGDEQRPPAAAADGAERGEEQRGLADARLASEQYERGGHEAAAEDAVELGHARRDPRSLLDANVSEPLRRAWSARGGLSVAN